MKKKNKSNATGGSPEKAGTTRKCILCGSQVETPSNADVHEFIAYAYEIYKKRFETSLYIKQKESGMIEYMLRQIDLKTLKIYWNWFVNYKGNDWWIGGATKNISGFSINIARIKDQCKISPSPPAGDGLAGPEAETLREAKDDLFDYLGSVLDPESEAYDHWAEKLRATKTVDDVAYWDAAFRQWRQRTESASK